MIYVQLWKQGALFVLIKDKKFSFIKENPKLFLNLGVVPAVL